MSIERCNPRFEYETGLTMEAHPEGECVWYDDHAAEVERLEAELHATDVARLEALAKITNVTNTAVGLFTGGCQQHDDIVRRMTFAQFQVAIKGYVCPLCCKAEIERLQARVQELEAVLRYCRDNTHDPNVAEAARIALNALNVEKEGT